MTHQNILRVSANFSFFIKSVKSITISAALAPARSAAIGHNETVDLALHLVRKRGAVSVVGVQKSRRYAFPLERFFTSGFTFRAGTCSVPEESPTLLPLARH